MSLPGLPESQLRVATSLYVFLVAHGRQFLGCCWWRPEIEINVSLRNLHFKYTSDHVCIYLHSVLVALSRRTDLVVVFCCVNWMWLGYDLVGGFSCEGYSQLSCNDVLFIILMSHSSLGFYFWDKKKHFRISILPSMNCNQSSICLKFHERIFCFSKIKINASLGT